MKNHYLLIAALLLSSSSASAQPLPNGDFENWADGLPIGWSANNFTPFGLFPVTQSADAHSGSSAARGEVLPPPSGSTEPYAPILQNLGAAVSGTPGTLTGWYKFDATNAQSLFSVSITLLDAAGGVVAIGLLSLTDEAPDYTQFSVPISYGPGSNDPVASAVVSIGLGAVGGGAGVGSWFVVDDLSLGTGTSVEELGPYGFAMGQPFPQPAEGEVTIPVQLASTQELSFEVLDTRGCRVALVSNGVLPAGAHTLTWTPENSLANGTYVLRMYGTHSTDTRLIVLQR